MVEYKKISVSPEMESSIINEHSEFGWVVVSRQEIYNKDKNLKGVETIVDAWGNATTYVKTSTSITNYVVVIFARDTNICNYKKIVELEKRYISCGGYAGGTVI